MAKNIEGTVGEFFREYFTAQEQALIKDRFGQNLLSEDDLFGSLSLLREIKTGQVSKDSDSAQGRERSLREILLGNTEAL